MDWNRRFFILLAIVTAFRIIYLFVSPLDLVADEAYYWDWSRQLDWGYFSKPPMIAWIIALFSRTIGPAVAVVRLPAVLLGTVSALALFLLARRMYDSRTAFWAAVAGMASPGGSLLAYMMTIDAPLVCFWSLALYFFWKVLEKEKGGSLEWFCLAAAIALGLLSKQVMACFIGIMFVFMALSVRDRYLLKSRQPYLYSLLGLAALVPPVLWNAHHGWITLHHTAGHFEGSHSFFIATLGEYIGAQMGVISPLTWILLAFLSFFLLFHFRSLDRRSLYLLCFSFLPLSVVLVLSLRQRIEPNWPAAFYPAGMVLLAAWCCGAVSAGPGMDSWRPYFKKGVIVGVVMALLAYALPFWAGSAPGPWAERLVARLQGWRQLGVEAGRAFGEAPRPENTFVLAFNRQTAAELAFYMPGHPRVYNWRFSDGVPQNQYDVWDGPQIGWDALLVIQESDSWIPTAMTGCFETLRRIEDPSSKGAPRRYSFYLGTSLKIWPHPAEHGK
jgi:4-amino-4-deoxy-L-arabinose transferase-like glycosyltransferase